jgi:hypothetical protein
MRRALIENRGVAGKVFQRVNTLVKFVLSDFKRIGPRQRPANIGNTA